jgi:hypothetical protein
MTARAPLGVTEVLVAYQMISELQEALNEIAPGGVVAPGLLTWRGTLAAESQRLSRRIAAAFAGWGTSTDFRFDLGAN